MSPVLRILVPVDWVSNHFQIPKVCHKFTESCNERQFLLSTGAVIISVQSSYVHLISASHHWKAVPCGFPSMTVEEIQGLAIKAKALELLWLKTEQLLTRLQTMLENVSRHKKEYSN